MTGAGEGSRRRTGFRWRWRATASIGLLAVATACSRLRAVSDPDFEPEVGEPVWEEGAGPRVAFDAAHANYHTAEGRYALLARWLRRDGYVVEGLRQPWCAETLQPYDLLVVSNALHPDDLRSWRLPTTPAFEREEIEAVVRWVEAGGALWLIADHMPFPGAAQELARAFGLLFGNAYASTESGPLPPFTRDAGLGEHPITRGRAADERIDTVSTFGGQAFRVHGVAPGTISPLLTLPERSVLRLPRRAGRLGERTATLPADGMLQGVALRRGEGRVAAFGEAAMFSAQRFERRGEVVFVMGMNDPDAPQNAQLALNVAHWLSGLLD